MLKAIRFFWTHKLFTAAMFSVSIFVIFLAGVSRNKPTLPPLADTGASYQDFTPGVTTKDQIDSNMGFPLEVYETTEGMLAEYDSPSPVINHEVIYKDNRAIFIKETITPKKEKTESDLTAQYGKADYILYGPDATVGFFLFVYPEKGLAYKANPNSGDLLEVWYFEPTHITNFLNTWGKDYSFTFPISQ